MGKKSLIFIVLFLIIILSICLIFYLHQKNNNVDNFYNQYKDTAVISLYNNPYIPDGFKKVETEKSSWQLEDGIPKGWNDGLVIEDPNGNQFVWVPVKLSIEDTKKYKIKDGLVTTNTGKILTEKELVNLLKYQGFYISRFEAGLPNEIAEDTKEFSKDSNDVEGKPISKQGQIPWNFIDWNTANINAKQMYNTDYIQSGLIAFNQWNFVIDWLSEENTDIFNNNSYGNYSDSTFYFSGLYSDNYGKTYKYTENLKKQNKNIILSTGISDEHCINNIYDLSGNLAEYTDVIYSTDKNGNINKFYSVMGGYYDNTSEYSISTTMSISSANSIQGFRIVLYFK